MLKAIENTSLLDDVYREDTTTIELENYMAARTLHEKGLFVLSGTMGNQLALRSHLTQPPHAVLCDYRGHILEWEAGGVASLCGALIKGVVPSNGNYLTLEDIQDNIVLGDDVHTTPTRVISLENTLGGSIMPLSEVRRISEFARANDVKLHLDGARIWEAVAAGAGSLPEFTSLFDSVSLCFSKGLGAPAGSILVGREPFIKHARWMRKAIGGGLRQPGVLTAAARVAVDETFGKDQNGKDGLLKKTQDRAKKISDKWQALGGKLEKPTETNIIWFDLGDAGISGTEFVVLGTEHGLRLGRGRVVLHYQVSDEALEKFEEVMKIVLERKAQNGGRTIERKIGETRYG